MQVFVASTNPVKIHAAELAMAEKFPAVPVRGIAVESGVSSQPLSDQETYLGAQNRVKNLYQQVLQQWSNQERTFFLDHPTEVLLVAEEGGVFQPEFVSPDEVWSTVWVAVMDLTQEIFMAGGAHFKMPKKIGQSLLSGEELGPLLGNIMADPLLKQKAGAIGLLTNNFVDRTAEYASIVRLAIGLWYGRKLPDELIDS